MPMLPLRPCTQSGCPALTSTGRCPAHPRPVRPAVVPARLYDDRRGSSAQRGYGYAWQQTRAAYLKAHPRCSQCGQPATVVDHVRAKRHGGADDESNYQPLCKKHHDMKTARERKVR